MQCKINQKQYFSHRVYQHRPCNRSQKSSLSQTNRVVSSGDYMPMQVLEQLMQSSFLIFNMYATTLEKTLVSGERGQSYLLWKARDSL